MDFNQNRYLKKFKKIGPEYYKKWEVLYKAYEADINSGAVYRNIAFTPHDIKHCMNIFENIYTIMPSSFMAKTNVENVFVLAVSVLLHDLYMARSIDERGNHAVKAVEEIFEEMYSEKHTVIRTFVPRSDIEFIADIIFAHTDIKVENVVTRKTFAEISKKYEKGVFEGESEKIDVPALAALLRMGDELDISYNRIAHTSHMNKFMPEEAKPYWDKLSIFHRPQNNPANSYDIILRIDPQAYAKLGELDKLKIAGYAIEVYNKIRKEFDDCIIQFKMSYKDWQVKSITLDKKEFYDEELKKKDEF